MTVVYSIMNAFNRQSTAIESSRELKVVLHKNPLRDLTNTDRKCNTCDLKMKTAKSRNSPVQIPQSSKINKRFRRNVRRSRKYSKNNENQVISIEGSEENVPVLKNCKVLLERKKLEPTLQNHGANKNEQKRESPKSSITATRLSTPLVKRLRKCEDRHYFESSLECSTVETSKIEIRNTVVSNEKIPIYKQNIIEDNCDKKRDPYELDIPDFDEKKPKKVRNLNNSRKLNKTMYDLLQKLDKNEKKGKKKIEKYTDKVNGVLKRVMNKVNDRNKTVTEVAKKIDVSKDTAESESMKNNQSTIKDCPNSSIFKNASESDVSSQRHSSILANVSEADVSLEKSNSSIKADFLGFANSVSQSVNDVNQNENLKIPVISKDLNEATNEQVVFIPSINGYQCESGFLGFHNNDLLKKSVVGQTDSNINVISNICLRSHESASHTNEEDSNCSSEIDADSQYFGFDKDNDEVDFHSHTTIGSPAFFNRRPKANSTMIGLTPRSPWRLTIPGRRNHHFLLIKPNSLPSLNQDMVLDHTMTEEVERNSKTRCEEVPRPQTPVQTSILDFVESSVDHFSKQNEDMRHSSLFDYDEFVVPKRKVLGLLQQNGISKEQMQSTPRKDLYSHTTSPNNSEMSNIFQSYEENEENRKPTTSKPFRINFHEIRQYKKNAQAENVPELPLTEENLLETNELIMKNQDDTVIEDVHLFEDFDSKQDMELSIKLPSITYKRKRGRKRLLSNACEEADEGKPKKKKKDMMTKAELDAFEKWAEQFNSMCKEVEEHDLEIE
ncbi:uncharacterized protein [Leptinotarsa decemlineata]|uniref:uncharacterized protein n=1 Tax=Leptinotarsa decemlineata TaxID=7539 RepID=UPI003D30A2C6